MGRWIALRPVRLVDEGLWRIRAAVANDRAPSPRRTRLARGRIQSLQDAGEPAARRAPPTARYAVVEAGGIVEMPVMPERPLGAAGAHVKLTERQEITPYKWVRPSEVDR